MPQQKPVQAEILYCKDGLYFTSFALVNSKWLHFSNFSKKKMIQWNWTPVNFGSGNLLYDVSSIETLSKSNHTLEQIPVFGQGRDADQSINSFVRECLALNRNDDKAIVIRNMILRFYFVGQFVVSPFVSMPISIIPEVLSQIQGADKQTAIAIYRLLKCIPELSCVSDRASS
jgi:hypothetical protein